MRERDLFIDFLRGFAILLVIGLHYFDMTVYMRGREAAYTLPIYQMFGHGYYGVTIFFVISGFLITRTSLKGDSRRVWVDATAFYIRRFTRIAPLLVLVVVFCGILCHLELTSKIFVYALYNIDILQNPMFWASVFTFQYNWFKIYLSFHGQQAPLQWDVLWSLAVEEQFYFIFPFVIGRLRTLSNVRSAMVFVIAAGAMTRLALVHGQTFAALPYIGSFTGFEAIAVGVLVAIEGPWAPLYARVAAVLGAALLIGCYLLKPDALGGVPFSGVAYGAGLLILASRNLSWAAGLRFFAPLAALGRLSYGAYLLHPLIFLSAGWLINASWLDPALGFGIVLVLTYAVARLSFTMLEQPLERWGRIELGDRLGVRPSSVRA